MSELSTPSRFWDELAREHSRDLDQFGPESVKRRQATRYFSWRWNWATLRRSEQFRFLLRNVPARAVLWCLLTPADLSDAQWQGVNWSRADRWLYTFAVRLLWLYAHRRGSSRVLALSEPELGGPLPVTWEGRLISQDLANSAIEVASIFDGLGGREPQSIVEVGAGYGRTAYALLSLFPRASYTIVDISPAIDISRWYLSELFPDRDLRFMSPADFEGMGAGSCDLGVSISSLQEMTPTQIAGYVGLLRRVVAGGRIYFKQKSAWHNSRDDLTFRFADLAIPDQWRELYRRRCPVQTSFSEAMWDVRIA